MLRLEGLAPKEASPERGRARQGTNFDFGWPLLAGLPIPGRQASSGQNVKSGALEGRLGRLKCLGGLICTIESATGIGVLS